MISATESFKNLAQLQVLALDDNNLSKFDSDTFAGLHRLEFLNLSTNSIRSVDRLLFKDLFSHNLQSLIFVIPKMKLN